MLSRLIEFSLRQPLLMLVLTVLLGGSGVWALRHLPIDAFPDVSTTQVKIIMKAPGMTPEEVETRITTPIEQELLGLPHQKVLRSVSKYGLADITLDFEDGTDIYWARNQVSERLGGVEKDLPPQASGGLAPITTPLGEMFMFTVEGPLSLEEKRGLLDWVIRPQLRTIPGVADVNALGGLVRTFEVAPDPAALAARGLSLAELAAALEAGNLEEFARLMDVLQMELEKHADAAKADPPRPWWPACGRGWRRSRQRCPRARGWRRSTTGGNWWNGPWAPSPGRCWKPSCWCCCCCWPFSAICGQPSWWRQCCRWRHWPPSCSCATSG